MRALAEQGRVRGYILFEGTRPVSYLYCPIVDDVLTYGHLGYDRNCQGFRSVLSPVASGRAAFQRVPLTILRFHRGRVSSQVTVRDAGQTLRERHVPSPLGTQLDARHRTPRHESDLEGHGRCGRAHGHQD